MKSFSVQMFIRTLFLATIVVVPLFFTAHAHAATVYWYSTTPNVAWDTSGKWFNNFGHSSATGTPYAGDDVITVGSPGNGPVVNLDGPGDGGMDLTVLSLDASTTGITFESPNMSYEPCIDIVVGTTASTSAVFRNGAVHDCGTDIDGYTIFEATAGAGNYGSSITTGPAIFYTDANYGTITGNATFHYPAVPGNAGTISGTITYVSFPDNVFIGAFDAGCSLGDTQFADADCFANGILPGSVDELYFVSRPLANSITDQLVIASSTFLGDATWGDNGASVYTLITSSGVSFNNFSANWDAIIGSTTFNGSSRNDGTNSLNGGGDITGTTTFNGSSLNTGTVTGDTSFNDNSSFNDYDQNYQPTTITGTVTFNGSSAFYKGTVDGDVIFKDDSVFCVSEPNFCTGPNQNVTGDVIFYGDTTSYPEGGGGAIGGTIIRRYDATDTIATYDFTAYSHTYTVQADGAEIDISGSTWGYTTTFVTQNGGTFTGGPARFWYTTNVGDSWQTLANWYTDENHTSQAAALPTGNDVVSTVGTMGTGPVVNLDTWTLSDDIDATDTGITFTSSAGAVLNSLVTVVGSTTFNGSSVSDGGITGNVTFNNTSENRGDSDYHITGNARFNGSSFSTGYLAGTATFYGTAYSLNPALGTITGTKTFTNDVTFTLASAWSANTSSWVFNGTPQWIFNTGGSNTGRIASTTFNGTSYNGGTTTGTTTFNGSAYNAAGATAATSTFNGGYNAGTTSSTTFNGASYNASTGTVNRGALFNGSGYNAGTISTTAIFAGTSYNSGSVSGTATFPFATGGVATLTTGMRWGRGTAGSKVGADAATFSEWYFNNNSFNAGITSSTTFNNTSYNFGTTSTATFNNSSYNSGTTTDTTVFNDLSSNTRRVNASATFNDASTNTGTITGNATFNEASTEDTGTVSGTRTRRYSQDVSTTTTRDFDDGNAWTILADSTEVDATNATFPDHLITFSTLNGGSFVQKSISSCASTLSYINYLLTGTIASGCTVTTNGVTIDGGGFSIQGNLTANGSGDGADGYDLTLSDLTVTGAISANGTTGTGDGGAGATIIASNLTSGNISVNGGDGAEDGGNGGILNIGTSTVSVLYANGGDSTDCGYGGAGGTMYLSDVTYTAAYTDDGADGTTGCGSPPSGGGGVISYTTPSTPSTPAPSTPAPTSNGNSPGIGSIIQPILNLIALTPLRPLFLPDLPNIGTNFGTDNFGTTNLGNPLAGLESPGNLDLTPLPTFVPNVSQFLFAPLPTTVTDALSRSPALANLFTSSGITKAQDLASLRTKPLLIIPPVPPPPGFFTVLVSTSTKPKLYLSSDTSYRLFELVKVKQGIPVTVSLTPLTEGEVSGTFAGAPVTFTKTTTGVSITITPSSPGRYFLTSAGAPFPLALDVEAPPVDTKPAKSPSIIKRFLGWLFNLSSP